MHKLLKRQLRRAGLESPGDYQDERWEKLLAYIDTAYTQADEDERSIEISSREMSQLYEQLKQNSESALSLERDRLKLVLKCIGNGLFWLSETGEVVDMNLAAESLLGWSREDLVGSDISQIVLNDELSNNLNTEQQIDNGSFVCKDGHLLRVSFLRSPILSENRLQGAVLIFRDISKQLADEKALIDARDMAEQASDAKSEFLSRMSHELRTPMNAILGFAQLLQCDPEQTLSEDNNDSVNEILKGGYHLLDLINEVLDLARIESGKVTVSIESVSLKLIVDDCLALIKPLMKENGISLSTIETNNSELGVMADYTRLKQVILNLLSNAVKYNSSHGIISVFIGQVDGKVRIGIQDTGAGLSEEEQIIIFKPFNRLESNSSVEGTGIGLSISRKLIEMMHGELTVESKQGIGSTFWVTLLESKLVPLNNDSDQLIECDETSVHGQYTLLYVEDNPANLSLVKTILKKRSNIKLVSAPDARLGIDLATSLLPELILMDINLPGMDGYEALGVLSQSQATKNIPVLAISANAMAFDIGKGLKAGFKDYITKPIDVAKFLKVIDRYLEYNA